MHLWRATIIPIKSGSQLGAVADTYNPYNRETEAGGSQVGDQLWQHSKTLSQILKGIKNKINMVHNAYNNECLKDCSIIIKDVRRVSL